MATRYGARIRALFLFLFLFLNSAMKTSASAKTTVDAFGYNIKNFVAAKGDKVGGARHALHHVMNKISQTAASASISVLGGRGGHRTTCGHVQRAVDAPASARSAGT